MTTIELEYESTTRNYFRYGSKKYSYIIAVYVPKGEPGEKPKSVKVIVEE